MDEKEFFERAEKDDLFIRDLAMKYIEQGGNMAAIDVHLGTRPGFVEDALYEKQELADKFQEAVDIIVHNKLDREASVRKLGLVETLNDIIDDQTDEKDGGPSVRDKLGAAQLLVKLTDSGKPKKRAEKRGLEDLLG